MKKFLLIITVMLLVIGGLTQDSLLWSYRLFLDEPVVHQVQVGEYLSKLSKAYYGSSEYWRELALINRAPNPDLLYPQEDLLIPDLAAIKRLRGAHTSTEVNALVREIEESLKPVPASEVLVPAVPEDGDSITAATNPVRSGATPSQRMAAPAADPSEKSGSIWLYGIIVVGFLGLVGLAWYYFFRRRPAEEDHDLRSDAGDAGLESEHKADKSEGKRKKVNMEEALMLD